MRMGIPGGLVTAAALALCACTDSAELAGEDKTVSAPEPDQAIQASKTAFRLAVFPDAKLIMSTPEGRAMQIETSASRETVADFYESEMTRLGYQEISIEENVERTRVRGVLQDNDGSVVQISIAPAESGPNRYTIIVLSKSGS